MGRKIGVVISSQKWAGLTKIYYRKLWQMFIDQVVNSVKNKTMFDEKKFHEKVTSFEINWIKRTDTYSSVAKGNTVVIADKLVKKYNHLFKY